MARKPWLAILSESELRDYEDRIWLEVAAIRAEWALRSDGGDAVLGEQLALDAPRAVAQLRFPKPYDREEPAPEAGS